MEDNREKKLKRGSVVNVSNPFWNLDKQIAVSAAIATWAFQPVDILKVRMQLGQGSGTQVIRNMVRNEGIHSFYKGLSAAVPRQAVFTMVVFKSYKAFVTRLANGKMPLSQYEHLSCVVSAGAVAACICSPADLILTRMQADASLLGHQRKNYANAFHALYRIIKDEGLVALWKGGSPTVMRTIANTAGVFAATIVFQPFLFNFKPNRVSQGPNKVPQAKYIHGYLITAGILPAALSKPFDYVRTQLQMMQPDASGKYPYSGPLDCATKTFKSGGLPKFYVGFQAYCFTCLPHILVTIAILKELRRHNISIKLKY